jgi:pyroglutamyl-peptidase
LRGEDAGRQVRGLANVTFAGLGDRLYPASMQSPRILVTGFGIFPGAPVNPTEALVARLVADPPAGCAFQAHVLPVEYAAVAPRLSAICGMFRPDIAVHFGLARECSGFRLERVARNAHAPGKPDQAGFLPERSTICDGPESFASTLPLDAIAERLAAGGLPLEWSDDAGGYLCNMVFTLSVSHSCQGLRPMIGGFVHVPPLKEAEPDTPNAMPLADIERGARIVITAAATAWQEQVADRALSAG